MSDNSVAAAAPVDNDSNDRHLLPSQSGAGRTAETSGNSSGGSNDLHLLSSTVIFLGSSSSDNDQPCSSNDDVINYPPTKAPSASVVVDKTSAGDADNLVKFKVFFHYLGRLKNLTLCNTFIIDTPNIEYTRVLLSGRPDNETPLCPIRYWVVLVVGSYSLSGHAHFFY